MRLRSAFAMVACIALAAVAPGRAAAQVNAESLRPNPLGPGWSGGIDGSFALYRGNIELLDIGGAGRVQHQTLHPRPAPPSGADAGAVAARPLPWLARRVLVTASARFAENKGTPFVSQAFAHARWTAMWHRRLGTDVFAQCQYNQFLLLQARAVGGGGVRVEIVHHPTLMVWGGSGYMFEYDRINVKPGAADAPETYEHRWTNYLVVRLALLDNRLLVQNTVYWQPRFDALDDVRVLDELEVLAKVNDVFALGTTLGVLYDSAPPTGVQSTDLRLLSMVRLSL